MWLFRCWDAALSHLAAFSQAGSWQGQWLVLWEKGTIKDTWTRLTNLCCMLESPFWLVLVQVPSCNLQSSAVGTQGKNATCRSCFQHCIGINVESKHHGMVGVEWTLKPIQIQPLTKSWVTPPDQAIQKLSNLALSTSRMDGGIQVGIPETRGLASNLSYVPIPALHLDITAEDNFPWFHQFFVKTVCLWEKCHTGLPVCIC